MKKMLIFLAMSSSVFAQTIYSPEPTNTGGWFSGGVNGGIGLGAPGGIQMGMNPGMGTTFPGANMPDTQNAQAFNQVIVQTSCPMLTSVSTDEQEVLGELKNYLTKVSKKPNCSFSKQDTNPLAGNETNVTLLQKMLYNAGSSDPMGASQANYKCYSKNVNLIGERNLALLYVDRNIAADAYNPYSSCLVDTTLSKEKRRECVITTYETKVLTNKEHCKQIDSPVETQKQIDSALVGIEQILNQAILNKDECGFKSDELFKITMNTFFKTKALSVVGPWGSVAGFGADLLSTLLDKIVPSDDKKASQFLNEIVSEENYEQNACLFYGLQQRMYCEQKPTLVFVPDFSCRQVTYNSDVEKLVKKYQEVKNIVGKMAAAKPYSMNFMPVTFPGGNPMAMSGPNADKNPEKDLQEVVASSLDELSELASFPKEDLLARVASLPKLQQAKARKNIEGFFTLIFNYKSYDPSKDADGKIGAMLISSFVPYFQSGTDQELDLLSFIVKTTPGSKLEQLKQLNLNKAIENILSKQDKGRSPAEGSRLQAKFNKYKAAVTNVSQSTFESRLERQFKDFENQMKFVLEKDKGIVSDPIVEGQMRNLIRHCTFMQEVYDPKLEGRMPKICERLTCQKENRLNWFQPSSDKQNYSAYKEAYCDKTLLYRATEEKYVKELKDPSGAKICGKKAADFF